MNKRIQSQNGDFICRRCGHFVSANPLLSAVHNRNHCPYCLWSRHLDLYQAGDRLSACKALMRPIGLTLKRSNKKFSMNHDGELMLAHLCSEQGQCDAVSINRIAADDDGEMILQVFHASFCQEESVLARLEGQGITLLGPADQPVVMRKLFGATTDWSLKNAEPMAL
jgi:hypothetical protein